MFPPSRLRFTLNKGWFEREDFAVPGLSWEHAPRARRAAVIRMALLSTERLFRHCAAHTAEPESASRWPIPCDQTLLFSVEHVA